MPEAKTYILKLTSAVALGGVLRTPNDSQKGIVEVDEATAKNMMHRGKARTPTAEELLAAGFEVPADEPAAGGEVLAGSSVLPAIVKIYGQEVQLGTIVAEAHKASGLSVEDWNAMEEAQREELLAEQIKAMKAAARAAK